MTAIQIACIIGLVFIISALLAVFFPGSWLGEIFYIITLIFVVLAIGFVIVLLALVSFGIVK